MIKLGTNVVIKGNSYVDKFHKIWQLFRWKFPQNNCGKYIETLETYKLYYALARSMYSNATFVVWETF